MPEKPRATQAYLDATFSVWPLGLPTDSAFTRLQAAHGAMRAAWSRSVRAYDACMADDLRTPLARAAAARKAAYDHCRPALLAHERALDLAERELKALEVERRCKVKVRTDDPIGIALGGEVRSWLRGLDERARDAAVEVAVREGDMDIVRAVVNAPASLSGLSPVRWTDWRERALASADPDGTERLALLRRAVAISSEAYTSLNRRLSETFDHAAIDAAEQRAEAAAEAMAAIDAGDTDLPPEAA